MDIVLPRRNPPTARRGDGKRIRVASENSNSLCRVVPPLVPRWGVFLNRGVRRRGKEPPPSTRSPSPSAPSSSSSSSPPLVHHRRHCQPTVGSSVLPSLQARRVSPRNAHTTTTTTTKARGLRKLNSSDGLLCAFLPLFLKPRDYGRLPFSLNNCRTPFHPPMRALSLFAVASFTLLIKPLSRERGQCYRRVCQVPTSVCCWQRD